MNEEATLPGSSATTIARGAVRGTIWLTASNYGSFAANILINLLIVRILGLSDVGVYALAFSVTELVSLVGAFSLDLALIHHKEHDDDGSLHDSAFILQLLLGLVGIAIGVVLYFALAPFGPFTREVRLFIVILALTKPLLFASNVFMADLEIGFRYQMLSIASFATKSLPNLAALALAWAGAGPSAYVARDVGAAAMAYAVYGLLCRHRVRWRWSTAAAWKLLGFSNLMFLNRALEVALQRFDRILIGSTIGTAELGSYHQGRYLAEMGYPLVEPITRLSFNVYSRIRNDRARLQRAYRLVNFFLIRGCAIIGVLLGLLAKDVVVATCGAKWLSAVPTVRLLALYAAALPILANLLQMLYGRGMMRQAVTVKIAQVAVFIPAVLLATSLGGPDATGWALLAMTLVGGALVAYYQRGVVSFSGRELFLAPALACGAAAAAARAATAIPAEGFLPSVVRLSGVSAVYFAALILIDRKAIVEHYRYLRALA